MARGGAASQSVPLRFLGAAAAAAGACLFAFSAPCTAAEAATLELSPPHCALRLRELTAQVKDKRKWLERTQKHVDEYYLQEALASVQLCEEKLAMSNFLRARCDSAGDAACVAHYGAEASAAAKALRCARRKARLRLRQATALIAGSL